MANRSRSRFRAREGTEAAAATLALSFISGDTLDPLITFARTTTASRFNASGVLVFEAINGPRFDYDPVTLAPRGLLIEAASANIAKWSRDLTNVLWVKTGITAAKDQIGIDGVANSASSITATSADGTCLQANTFASSSRLQSAYVKRLVGSGGVDMTTDGGTTWTPITVTASYTRVTIPAQTVTNPSIGFRLATSGDSIAVDCVQNEQSTGTVPSSYILTTSATVNKGADTAILTGVNFTSWYNAAEGTFVSEASSFGTGTRGVYSTNDGTLNNRMDHRPSGSASVISGNVSQMSLATVVYGVNTVHKVALAYQANNFGVASAGGSSLVDGAGAVPVGSTGLRLGELGTGGSSLNGHLRSLTYYNQRLPNSLLLSLTA